MAAISLLSTITNFVARGENNTRGPFTQIPSNICWMSNLAALNLTYNQLDVSPNMSDLSTCTIPWDVIDLSGNYLTTFPSDLFTIKQYESVYLNDNQLTTVDLSIILRIKSTIDLRNNKITSIVNPTNFTITYGSRIGNTAILMGGNPTLDLNDGIYEMYGACEEVYATLDASSDDDQFPTLTVGLGNIDFGTTRVNCSCDQYYIEQMLNTVSGDPRNLRISSLLCANEQTTFINYSCPLSYSTVNFTQVSPRLCQLYFGNETTPSTTKTTSSTSTTTTTISTTSTSVTTSTTSTTSTSTTTTTSTSATTTITSTTSSTQSTTSTSTTTTTVSTTSTSTTTTTVSTTSTSTTTTTVSTTSTSTTTTTSTSTTESTSSTSTTTTTQTTTSTSTTSSTVSTTSTSTTTTTSTSVTTSTTSSTSTTESATSTSTTTTTQTTTSTSTTTTSTTSSTVSTTSTSVTTSTTSTTSTSTTTTTSTSVTTSTTSSTSTTESTTSSSTTSTSTTTTTSTSVTTSTTSSTSTTESTTSTSTTTTTQTTTSTSTTSSTASTTSTSVTTSTTSSTTTTQSTTSTSTTTTTETTTSTSVTTSSTSTTTSSTASTTSTSVTTSTTSTTSASTTTTSETTSSTSITTSITSSTTTETITSTSVTTVTTSSTSSTLSTTSTSTTTTSTASLMTTTLTSVSTTSSTVPTSSSVASITTTTYNLNISTCQATFSLSNTNLLLTCPTNISLSLLPINDYSIGILEQITSVKIEGFNGARGPLQTIPANICFFTRLQVLNITFNRLNYLDSLYLSTNPSCLNTLRTLDISHNYFTDIPTLFVTKLPDLRRLLLQNNQLTSLDLSLFIFVSSSIDVSNNEISSLSNNANVNMSDYFYSPDAIIDLTNNSETIDLTDSIYEMYGVCFEVEQLFNTSISTTPALLTISLLNINFATSKINCNCNQYYMQKCLSVSLNNTVVSAYPLATAMCTDGELFYKNNDTAICTSSTANFTNTRPRLCQINPNNGNLVFVNTTNNNTGMYPYYLTQTLNSSYCLFIFFTGGKRVAINCLNGSQALAEISSVILNNIYFQNITQVSINNQSSFSQLPSYLCYLPSTSIDLSNQSFLILNSNTFPCSSNTTLQTINLAYNQIMTVNLTLYNWILIDFTSNNLTQLPYTLLNFNRNSRISARQLLQREILLGYNEITQFDLFVYTYASTDVNLQNNPFVKTTNGYHSLNNYQKQSLISGSVLNNVILPNQMRFLINDQIPQNYNTCTTNSLSNLIDILQYMKTQNVTIEIQCDCSSIYLREYFSLLNLTTKLTNLFSCSNLSSLTSAQFESLTETNCLANVSLSTDRLCEFASLEETSVSSSPQSDDGSRLLAVILGSVFGSLGFILIVAAIVAVICYKRASSNQTTSMATMGRVPYSDNTRSEMPRSVYDLPPRISQEKSQSSAPSFIASREDISSEQIQSRAKRQTRYREPSINYDADSGILRLEEPSYISSHV